MTRGPHPSGFYSVHEVGQILRVSTSHLHRLIHARKLRALRVGHQFRIHRADLDAYIQANMTDGGPA